MMITLLSVALSWHTGASITERLARYKETIDMGIPLPSACLTWAFQYKMGGEA